MSNVDKEKIKEISNSFADLLSSFKERKMQRVLLMERLKRLDIDTISDVLNYCIARSEENDLKFRAVVSCLMDVPYLVKKLGNQMMSDIYTRLEEKGYYNIMSLLVPHPFRRRRAGEDDIIAFPEMELIPLGVKKSLAKSGKKHTLEKLIYEDNPTVINNLLNNPRVTEKEVLKIITRRPVKPSIIKVVLNSKRWIDRHIIKKAIIRNPFTPTDIALNLLHFMLLQDLVVIETDAGLHYSVRDAAKKLIKKKREHYTEEPE